MSPSFFKKEKPMNYNTSVLELKGIGEKTAKLFAKLDITTVGQLLAHFPGDYERFLPPVTLAEARIGEITSCLMQVVSNPTEKKVRSLSITTVNVKDGTGMLQLTFFNMAFLKKVLKAGSVYVFRGAIQQRGSRLVMEQPRMYTPADYAKLTDHLCPRYSLTKGLSNQTLQKAIGQALSLYEFDEDQYSQDFLQKYDLCGIKEAYEGIHFPADEELMLRARRRIVFDEFFAFILMLRRSMALNSSLPNSYPMFETADTVRFVEQLPFKLTKGQKKVWQEIRNDLGSKNCMNRLIQGDVGSGKTIVALLALLECAANGYQGALMAPTEVLAIQHYESVLKYIKDYHVCFKPVLLVGSMTAKQKREAYEMIASGEANLIIGTHALIQEKVVYKSLALVVTDEQHRFGVRQREILSDKGTNPHILVMSATPIPRTLAVVLYGDMQYSVIDELPADRLPIKNCVVNTSFRPKAYEFIAKEVAAGRQAYVICPMVEEGELPDVENVTEYTAKIRAALPQEITVACLHGKMRPADKNRIMESFAAKDIDVLVSTTVIEVGINVPNATVMMVENAERFGLAQLHQLRGRVGRGEHQSYCIFISANDNKETMNRLDILNQSNDGFFIASQDLKLRGPGELLGVRQSGELAFRMADIFTDANVLKQASEAVDEYLKNPENREFKLHEHILRQLIL